MNRERCGTVLEFLGATQTVTGSRFLLSTMRARVLIDCGLYQGDKELRERNWCAVAPRYRERVLAISTDTT
jgi:Cft2 family RNA processing exonuclease